MKRKSIGLVVFLMVGFVFFFTGCANKQIVDTEIQPSGQEQMKPEVPTGEGGAAQMPSSRSGVQDADAIDAFENEFIYFDYDAFTLTSEASATLNKKAEFLKTHPDVIIELQGHCDERGTTVYNMALGERRARAGKVYLMILGIAENRITTVSYGEERPVDPGHNEKAWAKNRRGQFVVVNK